jgi:hypothetical protein
MMKARAIDADYWRIGTPAGRESAGVVVKHEHSAGLMEKKAPLIKRGQSYYPGSLP